MSSWRYVFTAQGEKGFQKLDQKTRQRIVMALERPVMEMDDPSKPSQSDLKKIAGKPGEWRLRVGDYRIRFEKDVLSSLLTVLKVGHRREAYQDGGKNESQPLPDGLGAPRARPGIPDTGLKPGWPALAR